MKIFLHGVFTVLMLFFVLTSCDKKKSNIQDVVQLIPTKKLEHLAIYYGWPSSLNSDLNQWNSQRVAADFARYSLVVLGAGLEETTHGDHENTKAILPELKR
ncbi:MAG: hypothetical protein N2Z70_01585 [Bdellovibrionaceae bacterium]|nr:hypothetical protein [Pseudobdellovibrionaceae bacterium]